MRYFLLSILVFVALGLSAQRVKILTYNIHHANPPSKPGKIDLEAIADVIKEADADVVGIQEVDVNVSRSEMVDQAKRLAELTGTHYFFSKGIDLEKGEYGVLILSKHKILNPRRYDLPMPVKSENRSLAVVELEMPGGKKIAFANSHFDLKDKNKVAQAQFVNEIAANYAYPVIFMGDLNAYPDSEPIKLLEKQFVRNKKDNKPTFPNTGAKQEIDYIMVSKPTKFSWKKYEVVDASYPSDHLPLYAEIVIK